MNPASYGSIIVDVDSTISYSSSENWYKKRAKQSESSTRSSGLGNSQPEDNQDDDFIDTLLSKNKLDNNHFSSHSIQENNKFSSHLKLESPHNVEVVHEPASLRKMHRKVVSIGVDEEFVEEIIESDNENSNNKSKGSITEDISDDDVVDEVGDVEMPMGETGHKFNQPVDDFYDSVVIEKLKDQDIENKANLFNQRMMNKYSNSYDYKSKSE